MHPVRTVAVVVAMQSELRHLVPDGIERHEVQAGIWHEEHALCGYTRVIAVRCGIGMVAAGAATEHVIANHQPEAVLNFGCTGSHVRDLYPGDVVIGHGAVAHSPGRIDASGEEIFVAGNYGVGADQAPTNFYRCDAELVRRAEALAAGWQPDAWPVGGPPRPPVVRSGNVGSGDIWNQHTARIERLHQLHGTLCEDMEAAAIAQIAALHGVPFLTIKDISNNEFHAVTDFSEHGAGILEEELGRRAGQLTWRVIEDLAGV